MVEKNQFPWWARWSIALLGGLKAIVLPLVEWWLARQKAGSVQLALQKVNEMYPVLHMWGQRLGASRVLLLKTSNGGGKPRPGHPLYSTICMESVDPPLMPQTGGWDTQRLDEQYSRMLAALIQNKYVHLVTEKMPTGLLRDVYLPQGIVQSEVMALGEGKKSFYYVSLNYVHGNALDTPAHREARRLFVQQLTALLRKHQFFV